MLNMNLKCFKILYRLEVDFQKFDIMKRDIPRIRYFKIQ